MVKPLTAGEKIARDLCEMDAPIDNIIEVDPVDVARRIDEEVFSILDSLADCAFRNERLVSDYASVQEELSSIRRIHAQNIAIKDAEIARWKTVPMKYRRMAFNAQLQDENAELQQQLAALKEENESLKLDAERYQWLKSQEPSKHDGYAIGYFDACGVDAWRMTTKDLDQAIDAAISKG